MKNKNLKALCEGALIIAAAMILGYLKLVELPQGGCLSLGMLPLYIYCNRWGLKKGLIVTFSYGLLQLLLDGAYAWSPYSMFLDYIFAYGFVGLMGIFKNVKDGIFIGSVFGTFFRFLFSFISGVTIYKINAPTEIFNNTITNPIIYSIIYNGSYIGLSLILCLIVLAIIYRPLYKYINGVDIV